MISRNAIAILVLSSTLAGCANIPRQSAELSGALTDQISDLQKTHIALLNAYFNEVETRMRQTISTEYKNGLVQMMEDKQKVNGKELTIEQYDKIMSRVQAKQDQVIVNLEKTRSEALTALLARYVLMQTESQSLQSLLESASKLQETRQRYTGALEAKAQSGVDFLQTVDTKVQSSLDEVNRVKDSVKKVKSDVNEVIDDAQAK